MGGASPLRYENRNIGPLWQLDAKGVCPPLTGIVRFERRAQPASLDPHDRIRGWIERCLPSENIDGDRVSLELVCMTGERLGHHVLEHRLELGGLRQRRPRQDVGQLSQNVLVVQTLVASRHGTPLIMAK